MSRRLVFILTLCVLAAAAVAIYPWTLTTAGPAQWLARQLSKDYGLDIDIRGRSTFSLLPRPRLKVENVEISGVNGRLKIREATVRGHVTWLSLLRGQVELSDITLRNAKTSLDMRDTDDGFWSQWAAWMQLRSSVGAIRELQTFNGSLTIERDKHPAIVLNDINSTTAWPGGGAALNLSGRLRWNGELISVTKASMQPAALLTGKSGPFALDISALESRLTATGSVQIDRAHNFIFDGKSTFSSTSLNRLTQWATLPVPLSPLLETVTFEGAFTTTRNLISWPSVQIVLGQSKLEGSLAFRFDTTGHMVSGTLATDALDLTDYLAPLAKRADENSSLSYRALNGADLDLRLSATTGIIGSLTLTDMALGLIVKPDRLEAALSRATLDNGTIKGRFLMTGPAANKEVRLQGNIENIDIGRFLPARADGQAPVSGQARGQLSLDGHGTDLQSVLKSSHGKMALSVANGEIRGVNLPAITQMKLYDISQPLPASTETTRFSTGSFSMPIEAGEGSFADGTLQSNGTITNIMGRLHLVDRYLSLRLSPPRDGENQLQSLVVSGPWHALTVRAVPGVITDGRF